MSFLIWFNFPPFAFPLVENIYSFLDILFTFLVFDFPLVASCFCCFSFFGFHLLCSPLYFIPFHVLFQFILSYFLSFFYFLPFPHLLVSRLIVLLDLSFSMLSFPFTFLCAAIFPNARQTPPKKKTDLSRFKWSHGALLDLVSSRGRPRESERRRLPNPCTQGQNGNLDIAIMVEVSKAELSLTVGKQGVRIYKCHGIGTVTNGTAVRLDVPERNDCSPRVGVKLGGLRTGLIKYLVSHSYSKVCA